MCNKWQDVNPRFTWILISNSCPFVLAHFCLLDNLGVGSRGGGGVSTAPRCVHQAGRGSRATPLIGSRTAGGRALILVKAARGGSPRPHRPARLRDASFHRAHPWRVAGGAVPRNQEHHPVARPGGPQALHEEQAGQRRHQGGEGPALRRAQVPEFGLVGRGRHHRGRAGG